MPTGYYVARLVTGTFVVELIRQNTPLNHLIEEVVAGPFIDRQFQGKTVSNGYQAALQKLIELRSKV